MAVNKSSQGGRERRESERADARLTMRIDADALKDVPRIVTQSENISASGVYCFASHLLPVGAPVSLSIVLPHLPGEPEGQHIIRAEGRVVRAIPQPNAPAKTPYELAFMFVQIEHDDKAYLHQFVLWRNLQNLRDAIGRPAGSAARRPARAKAKVTVRKSAARKTTKAKAKSRAKSVVKSSRKASARPKAKRAR